ncbi:MAG: hypothetical protein KAR13_01365 [Desulfobulbaceae bacterium]|nr:hypothetical protein [Desulfobulbaceae bacterium]
MKIKFIIILVSIICISITLQAFSESQPPLSGPTKAAQVEQSNPEKKKAVSNPDKNIPKKLPASIPFGGPAIPDGTIKKTQTHPTNSVIRKQTNHENPTSSDNYKFWVDIALAVFTIFIAISTFLLWLSTRALWKSTHAAFIATNRPRLRIRGIESDGLSETDIEPTWVYIANIGGSDATDITFKVVYTIRTGNTRRAPWTEKLSNSPGHGPLTLAPGECQTYEPRTKFIFETEDIDKIRDDDKTFLIIGTVNYRDANQIKRKTGFGWAYDSRTGEFSKPEKEDQYNYED